MTPPDIHTLFRSTPIIEKDGVCYFADIPADVVPTADSALAERRKWTPWRKANAEFLTRELAPLPVSNLVLDLGGGGPSEFRDLTARFRTVTVDFYPYPGVAVIADLNTELPFKDRIADIIILANVLEHIAEPNTLLAECERVLKPGGLLLGTVPYLINIHQRPYDYYRYTDTNLEYLLQKHRFAEIRVTPVLKLDGFLFSLTAHFFAGLIEKTEFSSNPFVAAIVRLYLRLVWKLVRFAYRLLAIRLIREKTYHDPDLPLGYLFTARKPR